VAIEGPLKELGIHDVFQLLDLSRKTGVLRVTSQLRRNQGTIRFAAGAVVSAEVRSNPHRLGELLVRGGKIAESDLELAKERQGRGDKRLLGEILVAMNAISQRELERQVRSQVEEVIFEVMGWREGYFSFTEGPLDAAGGAASVRIPTEALLMEGARRIDEWSRIERQIPHLGVMPALSPTAIGHRGELDLLPAEWELLAMIDGERTIREIAGDLGRSEFDVAKTVFGLHSADVVSLRDPQRGMAERADDADVEGSLARVDTLVRQGELESARVEIEGLLAAHARDPAVHLASARMHLAARRASQAEAAARRALELDPMLASAHRILGDAMVLQGHFADAAEWWDRWVAVQRHEGATASDRGRVAAAADAARILDEHLRGGDGR